MTSGSVCNLTSAEQIQTVFPQWCVTSLNLTLMQSILSGSPKSSHRLAAYQWFLCCHLLCTLGHIHSSRCLLRWCHLHSSTQTPCQSGWLCACCLFCVCDMSESRRPLLSGRSYDSCHTCHSHLFHNKEATASVLLLSHPLGIFLQRMMPRGSVNVAVFFWSSQIRLHSGKRKVNTVLVKWDSIMEKDVQCVFVLPTSRRVLWSHFDSLCICWYECTHDVLCLIYKA